MSQLQNASGLSAQFDLGTPVSPGTPWSTPTWAGSRVGSNQAFRALPGVIENREGAGVFSLLGRFAGSRGTLSVNFVVGSPGVQRFVAFLTDVPSAPVNYLGIGLTTDNRPFARIRNSAGVEVANVVAPLIFEVGAVVSATLFWNSAAAISGTRFASFLVGPSTMSVWTTDPQSLWTPFNASNLISGGRSFGPYSDYNGQVLNVQVSSNVVLPSGASVIGSLPLDRQASDSVSIAESVTPLIS
jgi:hypothetical protein